MEPIDEPSIIDYDYFDEDEPLQEEEVDNLTKYNQVSEEIEELRKKRKYYSNKLKESDNEEDINDCKDQMMKIRERLPSLVSEQKILKYKLTLENHKKERARREKEWVIIEEKRQKELALIKEKEMNEFKEKCKLLKDKIYKKLYDSLTYEQLNVVRQIFDIGPYSRELIFDMMFDLYPVSEIITVTSLFEIMPLVQVQVLAIDLKYIDYDKVMERYANNELIFNKLAALPDIKMTEKIHDVELVEFVDGIWPDFRYIDREYEEYVEAVYDEVYSTFYDYKYFFNEL